MSGIFFLVIDSQVSKGMFSDMFTVSNSFKQHKMRTDLNLPSEWVRKLNYGSLLYGMQPVKRDEVDRAVWTVMEMFPI